MAYDPVAQSGSTYRVGSVQYDAQGKPFVLNNLGQKVYLSPMAMDPYTEDRGPYRSGLLGGGSQWNSETGEWDQKGTGLEKLTLAGALGPFAAFGLGAAGVGAGPSGIMTGPVEAGASGGAAVGGGGAAAGGSGLLKAAVGLGGPLAARGLSHLFGGGNDGSPNGGNATSDAQLNELIQLMIDKATRAAPVHDAAMRLATRMAPTGEASPRLQANIAAASQPRNTAQTDPQVLAAIAKLMPGGGQ